jgi:predicted TIM-barrel fold metal-dependent hydrolase
LSGGSSSAIARAYVKAAPKRLVWGSDWPHPGVRDPDPKPDDAILIDLMLDWAPDEAVRNRILVGNAAKLYVRRPRKEAAGPPLQ